ncbi:MAG: FkbM family methyltransferase [Oscillatoriales cyanobacterium SM2_2_1]|nr:FkbM family methyltransferase [Oscillatoriales cyanobacterium SM2_2_1]
MKALLAEMDQCWFPEYFYVLSPTMGAQLQRSPLVIADVGAAMGVDVRWRGLGDGVRFLTFEPDGRSQTPNNFAIGLGQRSEKRTLYLTQLPAASSLLEHHRPVLRDFATYSWHEPAGTVDIELVALDDLLVAQPENYPDFLKTDVEGFDLEVLRGAERILSQHTLGVQVEVSFIERHVGAPFFGEVDQFLRDRQMVLFSLQREHWLRHNLTAGVNSQPQLIWGDAVYFLTRDAFGQRVARLEPSLRLPLMVKMLALLLVYGAHDYAIELTDFCLAEHWLTVDQSAELQDAIRRSVRSPLGSLLRSLPLLLLSLMASVLTLGRGQSYVQRYLRRCVQPLLYWARRGGVQRSVFSDF